MMKKILSLVLILPILCFFTGCYAQENISNISDSLTIVLQIGNPEMTVNGTEKGIDSSNTVPIIEDERTLLPVRAVVEAMGGNVEWSDSLKETTLILNDTIIKLVINSKTAYLNNKAEILDTAPVIINDRTMLPIRFIAENFGFTVVWEENEQRVIIEKTDISLPNATAIPTAVPNEENNADTLIVYYSKTETTKGLAEKIHNIVGGDIIEIMTVEEYPQNYQDTLPVAQQQLDSGYLPELQPLNLNTEQYDNVFIGYPIWWGQVPPAMQTFLNTYDLSDKNIFPFCTSGTTGIDGSLTKVKELCANSTVKAGYRGTNTTTENEISEWLGDWHQSEQKLLGGLSPEAALEYMKNTPDLVIVQVNTAEWKITPGFTGALWIPHDEIAERYDEIPKGKPVILHCGAGVVSVPAYNRLKEKRPDIPELSYIAGSPKISEYNEWLENKK